MSGDNLQRMTNAAELSLVTVEGIITEFSGRYPRELVLTDASGSLTIVVNGSCQGGTAANDRTDLVGTYAVVAGRREDRGQVLASIIEIPAASVARELLIPATLPEGALSVLAATVKAPLALPSGNNNP
ncbi:hypothetical protein AB0K51_19175 [Kitasatospora sp. NPDC049285]|uniref:hypothetical protein n=1 Tax=Kitasatospora sp. NPDC049285 TaxID=3157096 RepID=UPI00344A2B18